MSKYAVSALHPESQYLPSQGIPRTNARAYGLATEHSPTPTIRLCLNVSCAVACIVISLVACDHGYWAAAMVCWLAGGHFLHTFALSFHDAAHGTYHPDPDVNEFLGHLFGTLILVPLTAYRRAHARHHASLASVVDPELYPFVDPGTSRLFRLTCAFFEITLGYLYTPLLFLRSVWNDQKLTSADRRRIVAEYVVIALMVMLVFTAIEKTGTWHFYFTAILPTLLVAGAYQTLNKYTEHLGLFGETILESTRTVLPRDSWNQAISSLLQHVDHHGTHHVRARIPFFELPPASEEVYCGRISSLPVYYSYATAFWAMLKTLPDPKAGPQWRSN